MARPTCPKCDSVRFAMTEFEPTGSSFRLMAVHCAKCGAVVGVTEFFNAGALIQKLAKALQIKI